MRRAVGTRCRMERRYRQDAHPLLQRKVQHEMQNEMQHKMQHKTLHAMSVLTCAASWRQILATSVTSARYWCQRGAECHRLISLTLTPSTLMTLRVRTIMLRVTRTL